MSEPQTKLRIFENMVMRDAYRKYDAVTEELRQQKEKALKQIRAEVQADSAAALRRATAAAAKEKNERLVHRQLLFKQEVLGERQRLIDEIFARVQTRLEEFVRSDEYEAYLIELIGAAKERLPQAEVVSVTEYDLRFSEKIRAMGLLAEEADEAIIGGCLLVDTGRGVRLDETLATRLRDAKDSFLERYNLKI